MLLAFESRTVRAHASGSQLLESILVIPGLIIFLRLLTLSNFNITILIQSCNWWVSYYSLLLWISLALKKLDKGFKGYHDDRNVVKSIVSSWGMKNFINCYSYNLMHSLRFIVNVSANYGPNQIVHLLSLKLIKYSIGTCKHIVKSFAAIFFEDNIGLGNNHIRIAS